MKGQAASRVAVIKGHKKMELLLKVRSSEGNTWGLLRDAVWMEVIRQLTMAK